MAIARLEVRLDQNHKRKLKEMADEQKTPVSEVVEAANRRGVRRGAHRSA